LIHNEDLIETSSSPALEGQFYPEDWPYKNGKGMVSLEGSDLMKEIFVNGWRDVKQTFQKKWRKFIL